MEQNKKIKKYNHNNKDIIEACGLSPEDLSKSLAKFVGVVLSCDTIAKSIELIENMAKEDQLFFRYIIMSRVLNFIVSSGKLMNDLNEEMSNFLKEVNNNVIHH